LKDSPYPLFFFSQLIGGKAQSVSVFIDGDSPATELAKHDRLEFNVEDEREVSEELCRCQRKGRRIENHVCMKCLCSEVVFPQAAYSAHPSTTPEIRMCFSDLKVLGKRDFRKLLKWRMEMRGTFC
jgi:hypothetical protein